MCPRDRTIDVFVALGMIAMMMVPLALTLRAVGLRPNKALVSSNVT